MEVNTDRPYDGSYAVYCPANAGGGGAGSIEVQTIPDNDVVEYTTKFNIDHSDAYIEFNIFVFEDSNGNEIGYGFMGEDNGRIQRWTSGVSRTILKSLSFSEDTWFELYVKVDKSASEVYIEIRNPSNGNVIETATDTNPPIGSQQLVGLGMNHGASDGDGYMDVLTAETPEPPNEPGTVKESSSSLSIKTNSTLSAKTDPV